jgi:hypothetical protein
MSQHIDAYLDEVATHLRGPRGRRARILAELRDGLEAAVADEGPAAITRFGAPTAVASAFAAELSIAYARRALALYVATGPLVGIWWLLLLHPHPWQGGIVALVAAIPVIPLAAAGLATTATTFATTGRLMRWLPEAGPRQALTAVQAVAALAIASDLAIITAYLRSGAPMRSLAAVAIAASLIRIGCGLATAHRAGALRRHATDH